MAKIDDLLPAGGEQVRLFRCTEPFSYDQPNGVPIVIGRGEIRPEDDEAVRKAPRYFQEISAESLRTGATRAVETATAAPGASRSLSRPSKPAA